MSEETTGDFGQQVQTDIDQQTQQGTTQPVGLQSDALDPARLQSELEQLKKANEQLDRNYKEVQGAFTRSQQALRSLSGGVDPQQPRTPGQDVYSKSFEYAKNVMKLPDQDAQNLATMQAQAVDSLAASVIAPLEAKLQSFQAAQQVDPVIAQAAQGNAWVVQQLADPNLYQSVKTILAQNASQGYAPTPQTVVSAVGMAFAQTAGQAGTQAVQPQQPFQFAGTSFQGTGFQVRPQQGPQRMADTPYQNEIQGMLDKTLNLKK